MLNFAVVLYSTIAIVVSSVCLVAFFLDTTTPKTDLISWNTIFVATLFWPLVVPFSYWELSSHKTQHTTAIPEQDYFLAVSNSRNRFPQSFLR